MRIYTLIFGSFTAFLKGDKDHLPTTKGSRYLSYSAWAELRGTGGSGPPDSSWLSLDNKRKLAKYVRKVSFIFKITF